MVGLVKCVLHKQSLAIVRVSHGMYPRVFVSFLGVYSHTRSQTHRSTLHSCWPCDSSSKGYRWLHFVQAYRADVAILPSKSNRAKSSRRRPPVNLAD